MGFLVSFPVKTVGLQKIKVENLPLCSLLLSHSLRLEVKNPYGFVVGFYLLEKHGPLEEHVLYPGRINRHQSGDDLKIGKQKTSGD